MDSLTDRRSPKDLAQALALAAIALMPLIPRPTFGGYIAAIAPVVSCLALYFALLHALTRRGVKLVPGVPLYLVVLATSLYGARVVWDSESDELLFFASRVVFILTIVACCIAFSGDSFDVGLRWFINATLVLSALVLIVGVTGIRFLEPALHGRVLGFRIPFFKTAGVPRSFGEQGVILAIMLGYFFAYRTLMPRWMRWALGFASAVVAVMAQSRNVLLCAVAVPVMWLAVSRGRWVLVRLGLVAAGLATFVMDQIVPLLQDTFIGRALIGQGILERNVEARFTLVGGALSMIAAAPLRSLIGWSHAQWRMDSPVDVEAGVHNHFVSSIMFVGIIGGAFTIWALYVRPLGRVVKALERLDPDSLSARRRRFAVTSAAGVLICMNFYEGFFSQALALQIGILWMLMVDTQKEDEQASRLKEGGRRRAMRSPAVVGQSSKSGSDL